MYAAMKIVQQFDRIPFDRNTVITVGTFDGVHLAHRKILERVVSEARARAARSVLVTFDPHPREVVGGDRADIRLLTTIQERMESCEQLGIDWFLVVKFDKDFSRLSFRDFTVKYLVEGIGVRAVVEGYDHHWGRGREGNIDALERLGKEFGFDVIAIEPLTFDGAVLNSTVIRNALSNGAVDRAAEWLGRPYALKGKVVPGARRGRLLGYPTANVQLDSAHKLIPMNGIYFVRAAVGGRAHYGIASIGVRPTFETNGTRIIEVYLLDFEDEIYGLDITVYFLNRLRDELKFDSADQLVQQMHRDKALSRRLQAEYQKK
jgi:riboflavin kinase/FMN adenylyltransferase